MAKSHLRVAQNWQRHFDAPVALSRTAAASGDIVAADEDGSLYMLAHDGRVLWSQELPFLPVALGIDHTGEFPAALSADGVLVILDRSGQTLLHRRVVWRPTSLDVSPSGAKVAMIDGAGKVCIFDRATASHEILDEKGRYHYVRFTAFGRAALAVGQFGQVMYVGEEDEALWQKDFRCHTRLPATSESGDLLLVPSPHFGIIVLGRDGRDRGLFEVPKGPKCVSVTADGNRIIVINEDNELIIFQADGKVLFRQPFGRGVRHVESNAAGSTLTSVMTAGALEGFSVDEAASRDRRYVEFGIARPEDSGEGPAVVWRKKVFSQLGGLRGGQLALAPSARHLALLDVEGRLRVFDSTGAQVAAGERMYGLQPAVKAGRTHDFLVAASSRNLLAIDLRSYRQRRLSLKNEWTTHFDISPKELYFAVADFFQGISLYDETFERAEFLETEAEVTGLSVDGNCHTLAVLSGGVLAFYNEHGTLINRLARPTEGVTVVTALGSGFAVGATDIVDTFDSEGRPGFSVEVKGKVASIQPTRSGLVITTTDGTTSITNSHGTVVGRMQRRAQARYFSGQPSTAGPDGAAEEIIAVESHGRILTARSTDKGVLWRREMDDDITAMEVSPEGAFVAVISGVNLYLLATAAGEKTVEERLYLEI